jgi:formylmethanofuran dehydrogenase subunit B
LELKQYASDLDLYESVRLTPEGHQYGIALLDRLLTMGRYVDRNLHTLHSSLLVAFLEERLHTVTIPTVRGRADDGTN